MWEEQNPSWFRGRSLYNPALQERGSGWRLVSPPVFKAVCGVPSGLRVGSIPMRSRHSSLAPYTHRVRAVQPPKNRFLKISFNIFVAVFARCLNEPECFDSPASRG